MWAGPLCTWICQTLGATIVKVEPAFRPDGTRAAAGGGIYPMGRQRLPGVDSGLWNALNRGKQHFDLDLRLPKDREEFLELARRSDLVLDSFSPRVMPNFGLDRELPGEWGSPTSVSMPAFPPGAHRDWVSYGTGVHALIGLGDLGAGRFGAPAVSYPDPVAGLTGAFAATCAVVASDLGQPLRRMEVPLQSSTLPLLALGRAGQPWGAPHSRAIGEVLFDEGRRNGEFVIHEVAGLQLEHPLGPIRIAGPPSSA
jgi:crotonobetainyl-CoA:carnitine CoA-transferase CaiB-like acyl-CoA transferase